MVSVRAAAFLYFIVPRTEFHLVYCRRLDNALENSSYRRWLFAAYHTILSNFPPTRSSAWDIISVITPHVGRCSTGNGYLLLTNGECKCNTCVYEW